MYAKYGSYPHDSNLTGFTVDSQVTHNPRSGTPLLENRRISVNVTLLDTTQDGLRTQINELIEAYRVTGVAWEFYHDDGALSSHSLPLSGLLGPIRVVQYPSFPESNGAEYATQRTCTITLEATYVLNFLPEIVQFREQVSIVGTGGPRKIATELITGVPVSDTVANYTIVRATQTGQAVGFLSYPTPPTPLWPSLEDVEQREIATASGERFSAFNVINYPITWKYAFTGGSAMVGVANS